MSTQKVVDGMITGTVSSNKLTGVLPALDGSALTGIVGMTKSSSDPAINSNPSGGTGTIWLNTVSGEMWCCTDATTDANVWTNVGAGSGNVEPFVFQGESYGYTSGGYPYPSGATNIIDKFSFASATANATDVGDLTVARSIPGGQSSTTHGYTSGGFLYPNSVNIIDRFSFATDGNATDVGDLTAARQIAAGQQY